MKSSVPLGGIDYSIPFFILYPRENIAAYKTYFIKMLGFGLSFLT